jgi:hypothetical protein
MNEGNPLFLVFLFFNSTFMNQVNTLNFKEGNNSECDIVINFKIYLRGKLKGVRCMLVNFL